MLPNGVAEKSYICEITRLLYNWNEITPLRKKVLKSFHQLPSLSKTVSKIQIKRPCIKEEALSLVQSLFQSCSR